MKHPSFLLLLLFVANTSFAQKDPAKVKSFTVHLSGSDYTVRASVQMSSSRQKPKPALTYYWYAANKINQTEGGFDGKLLDGSYAVFFLDNSLKEKGNFEKGLKQGTWTSWYANGKMHEQVHYRNSRSHGEHLIYDESGKLVKREFFRNGLLHGKSETYVNGQLSATSYYKEGKTYEPRHKKEAGTKKEDGAPAVKKEKKKIKFPALFKKKEKTGDPKTTAPEKAPEKKEKKPKKTKDRKDKTAPATPSTGLEK